MTTPAETFPFEDLPSELQTAILEREFGPENLERVRSTRQVSHGFREVTNRAYFQRICQQPISQAEVRSYLSRGPQIFGIFTPNVNGSNEVAQLPVETRYELYLNLGKERPEVDYTRVSSDVAYNVLNPNRVALFYGEFTPYNEEHNLDVILTTLFTSKSQLDLISTYRIVSKRLGCQNLDPEFARTWIKRELAHQVDSRDRDDIYDLCSLHLYLLGNCRVMNLLTEEVPFIELHANLTTPMPRRALNPTGGYVRVDDPEVEQDLAILRSQHLELNPENEADIKVIRKQIPRYHAMIQRFLDNPIL